MSPVENFSLKAYNTFGLDAKAKYFVEVQSMRALQELFADKRWHSLPWMVLGGGSNILLLGDVEALVVRNALKGIEKVAEDSDFVWLKAGAGENWNDFVSYCVASGLGGVENLSLIPGTVGAAPMQNIGAYGVEIKEVFEGLEAINLQTGDKQKFDTASCRFGYRESVFKYEYKGRLIITSVTFRLRKKPELRLSYGDIVKVLDEMGVTQPTIRDVSEAVVSIRRSKLPDPAEIGNAGSFFKNPEISEASFLQLRSCYSGLPGYPTATGVKIPAGWLIEQAGWKGYREGHVGVHDRQALVLVHYGGGTGHEIRALAEKISTSVTEKFGVTLRPEVNFI